MSAPQPAAVPRLIVAVDGPSGSGKSSVSREVARRLGLEYLDTGAMYRAATWSALHAGLDLEDTDAVAAHVRALDLRMGTEPSAPSVSVATADGVVDVAEAIRRTEISSVVSKVAVNLDVRAELHRRQRAIIEDACDGPRGGVVAEGRDITTVVAPHAQVRLLLTASEEARVARRARDLHGTAGAAAVAATTDQVVRRDADDSRVAQFLTAADGVTHLDSSDLDFDQTVEAVLALVAQVTAAAGDEVGVLDPVR